MDREQFISRLEEVGFIKGGNIQYDYRGVEHCSILVIKNKPWFWYHGEGYSFDELEQFLLDEGITEKPFDAHEYLLEMGFINNDNGNSGIYLYKKHTFIFSGSAAFIPLQIINYFTNDTYGLRWTITKQSIDKAIKLIDFLTELEKNY